MPFTITTKESKSYSEEKRKRSSGYSNDFVGKEQYRILWKVKSFPSVVEGEEEV